jgi:hypothetical protein
MNKKELIKKLDEIGFEDVPPMGVSSWRAYGKQYGYWDFFENQIKLERDNHWAECLKEHRKICRSAEGKKDCTNYLRKFFAKKK